MMTTIRPLPQEAPRRVTGLFRRWELAQVLETAADYRIEDAGTASDGTPLLAIYRYPDTAIAAEEVVR